ncbi:MAG: alpha/beta hydrolase [Candidatus Thorarchaeota archaeon]
MKSTNIQIPLGSNTLVKGLFTGGTKETGLCVLFLHPHPRYGGDIDNHVITELERACQEDGLSTFKFSFRGAGSNLRGYQGIRGSRVEVRACMDYMKAEFKISSFGLVGYSYGGSVALSAALMPNVKFLVTLSASVELFKGTRTSLDQLLHIDYPILLFHGMGDTVVPFDDMRLIESSITRDVHSVPLAGEGHFYQNSLTTVIDEFRRFLKINVTTQR